MKKKDDMPSIVYWGLYGINSKGTAYFYVILCVVLAVISIFKGMQKPEYYAGALFFVVAYWYIYCIKWVDKNSSWGS